jgi:hypothetical protein
MQSVLLGSGACEAASERQRKLSQRLILFVATAISCWTAVVQRIMLLQWWCCDTVMIWSCDSRLQQAAEVCCSQISAAVFQCSPPCVYCILATDRTRTCPACSPAWGCSCHPHTLLWVVQRGSKPKCMPMLHSGNAVREAATVTPGPGSCSSIRLVLYMYNCQAGTTTCRSLARPAEDDTKQDLIYDAADPHLEGLLPTPDC